jgi:mannose-6-phosphate isomerase-like protein (cupin superfamily)
MKGYVTQIERDTRKNADFRRVLYTGKHSQLVLMSLEPGEEIGEETHEDVDQFFRFEGGEGKVFIDGIEHRVKDGNGVIVPAGAKHNVVNTSKRAKLRLYTIYSPPEHKDGVVRHTKRDAMRVRNTSTDTPQNSRAAYRGMNRPSLSRKQTANL